MAFALKPAFISRRGFNHVRRKPGALNDRKSDERLTRGEDARYADGQFHIGRACLDSPECESGCERRFNALDEAMIGVNGVGVILYLHDGRLGEQRPRREKSRQEKNHTIRDDSRMSGGRLKRCPARCPERCRERCRELHGGTMIASDCIRFKKSASAGVIDSVLPM